MGQNNHRQGGEGTLSAGNGHSSTTLTTLSLIDFAMLSLEGTHKPLI